MALQREWLILDAGGWGRSYVGELFDDLWDLPLWEIARRSGRRRPPDYSVISEIPSTVDENTTWEELERLDPELFEPILETRPGRVADSYPQDVSDDETPEDEDVAHTWLHIGQEFIGGLINPQPQLPQFAQPINQLDYTTPTVRPQGAAASVEGCEGMAWSGGTPPKGYKVVNYCGRGVLRKIRRRRRRRMLTASDASDLATIVGIVGKGQMASSMINRTRS